VLHRKLLWENQAGGIIELCQNCSVRGEVELFAATASTVSSREIGQLFGAIFTGTTAA